jgi:hypothetical protein
MINEPSIHPVADRDEREESLHSLLEEELEQLRDASLETHLDGSLSRFDHQYEDSFEKPNHEEESNRTSYHILSSNILH